MSKRMNGETVFSDEGLERAVRRLQRALEGPVGAIPGYAAGTLSASRGLAWVGESGTELVGVSGGERVYTATQSAALAGAAVSFAGLLGFVGLVAPHMVRRLVGGESRRLLAGCALGGAALLTVCDVAARTLFAPYELPVGVVLSLAGGPFFLWLLFRKGRGHP